MIRARIHQFTNSPIHQLQSSGFCLVADLQIPAVGIFHVEALEVLAHHVGPRMQSAALELGFHLVGVPRLHAPGDVIDDAGQRRTIALAAARRRRGRRGRVAAPLTIVADDDFADVADLR